MDVTAFISIAGMLAILFGSLALFISDRLPMDGTAFIILMTLLLSGLVPESEILSGFSNPAVMTVVAMIIISAGLSRTGIVNYLVHRLNVFVGQGRTRLTFVLSIICGFFSAFISNTATVAVLLPVTLSLTKERNISPTRVLLPIAFAAQFGGVCTLIGTSTNLLVNTFAEQASIEPFGLFEFAELGLIYFAVGTVYMLLASWLFLPNRATVGDDSISGYQLKDYMTELRVQENSILIGQTGAENDLVADVAESQILEIVRDGKMIWSPAGNTIREGDILLIKGDVNAVLEAAGRYKLKDWAEGKLSDAHLKSDDITLLEVMVPRGSHLVGRTLEQMDFYWRYHAAVLGLRRWGEVVRQRVASVQLQVGDTLLLQGNREDLARLAEEKDFMFLKDLSTMRLKKRKALAAVLVLLSVLVAAASGLVSILTASLAGAAAMVILRCLTLEEAYEAVDMKVLIMLACLIPLAVAMENTGTSAFLAHSILGFADGASPYVGLGIIYGLTMVLTAFMSNAATAVLLAPLAITMAQSLNVDPHPFLIAVTFAASTCFATPVGYQTNTMVYTPGAYKYADFIKIGIPLNLIFFAISVVMIPHFWPF